MLIDAATFTDEHIIEADVCVVGSGVAGLTFAQEFLGSGVKVCVLESGGIEPESETQELARGENVGILFSALDEMRERRVGGTSHRWLHSLGRRDGRLGARMRPLDAIDLEKRDAVPYSGWPITWRDLKPYYERAETAFHLAPGPYDYHRSTCRLPRHLECKSEEVRTAIIKIGPRDPFTEVYWREIGRSQNITLCTHATVTGLETNETGKEVISIRAVIPGDRTMRVRARTYVLALGGIETARLLLISNRQQQITLGNENKLIGRFFMEHPHFYYGEFVPATIGAHIASRLYRLHSRAGGRLLGNLTLSQSTIRNQGLLNLGISLKPYIAYTNSSHSRKGIDSLRELGSSLKQRELPHDASRHLRNIASDMGVMAGRGAVWTGRRMQYAVAPKLRLSFMTEQAPNPDSRVTLSDDRDRLGQPRARLDWRLQDVDIQSIVRSLAIIDRSLRLSGWGHIEIQPDEELRKATMRGGYHHMGTTRMASDPATGVVDGDCRVYGTTNLFVASSSVFPTGGFANPTLTIGALAIRLADHIRNFIDVAPPAVRTTSHSW